jgi:hypothetical protein
MSIGLLIASILVTASSSQLIRNVPALSPPSLCTSSRQSRCSDLAIQFLQRVRHSELYEFDFLEILDSPLYINLPEATRACLRFQLYTLRRSLFVSGCVMAKLMGLNQERPEGVPLVYSDFRAVVHTCSRDTFGGTGCQIHAWYSQVIAANAGQTLDLIGVHNTAVRVSARKDRNHSLSVWRAPPQSCNAIVDTEIARLIPPVGRKRQREEGDVDPDHWLDELIDALDAPSPSPIFSSLLQPHGVLRDVSVQCTRPLAGECPGELTAALQLLRKKVSEWEIPSVATVLGHLGIDTSHPNYKCVFRNLKGVRDSLFVTEPTLARLLSMNQKNVPLSSSEFGHLFRTARDDGVRSCPSQLWYFHVINPIVGRTLHDANLSNVSMPDQSMKFYPSVTVMRAFIDVALSRIQPVK